MKNKTDYEIVIIGAGASGLVAADVCGAASLKVLLLESKQKPGLKLLITGGGRCNISNTNMHVRHFNSRHPRTVKNVLAAFPLRKTITQIRGVVNLTKPGTCCGKIALRGFLCRFLKINPEIFFKKQIILKVPCYRLLFPLPPGCYNQAIFQQGNPAIRRCFRA